MTNKKNLIIKSKSASPLRLFEAADSTPDKKKYIFQGVFTACSTPEHKVINRNNRSYPATECLRHLAYLRENIQQNGFILGELDHPIDRFDTQMKEASHKITDLWYDQNTACIMGKLEVLDTPNGEIARKLIDAGYPLFVSSRAAGEVDSKTHEVHIDQIFTYDIVCTPGFAEARLERVNESMRQKVSNYLNESVVSIKKEQDTTKKYGILTEGVSVCETSRTAPAISEEARILMEKEPDMKDLCTPLLEGEDEEEFKLPQADLNPATVAEADEAGEEGSEEEKHEEKKEDKKELTDEEKAEKRKKIIGIDVIDKKDAEDGDELTDEEKAENREKIHGVEGIEEKPEDEEKPAEDKDEKKDEESEKTEESEEIADDDEEIKSKDKNSSAKDAEKVLNDCNKADDVKKQTEDDMDKFQKLLSKAKKLSDVKESIVKLYPFSISLSDENFAKFAALSPAQKNIVNKYIVEHQIFDIQRINDTWKTPLMENARMMKNWLRFATDEDKKLFSAATKEEQDAIEESAKYVIINNENDAERFWQATGLRQRAAQQMLQESLQNRYVVEGKPEKMTDEQRKMNEDAAKLGYSVNYFQLLEDSYNA